MNIAFENAAQAIDWINGLRYAGEKKGLENTRALLDLLDHPERRLRMVHVAGTNGKGSTCSMLERMLRGCGMKTGLYTSPYLMRFQERMRINGIPIDDDALIRVTSRVKEATERLLLEGVKPTAFELGTAIAFSWFAEQKTDVAVIEVGLGGRLDSTNVIQPEACLIAPIGMDHTKILGDTLPQIAMEKAGIIKKDTPVAVAPQQTEAVRRVFYEAAAAVHAPILDVAEDPPHIHEINAFGARFSFRKHEAQIQLAGRHQIDNACLSIAGIDFLRRRGFDLPEGKCMAALKEAVWPGRLEWIGNDVLIDGAHNPHGAQALANFAKEYLSQRRIITVVGMMKDKDVESCVRLYADISEKVIATQAAYPRAMPHEELRDLFLRHGVDAVSTENVASAVQKAREFVGENGVILICGSLYVAGEARMLLRDDGGRL